MASENKTRPAATRSVVAPELREELADVSGLKSIKKFER